LKPIALTGQNKLRWRLGRPITGYF